MCEKPTTLDACGEVNWVAGDRPGKEFALFMSIKFENV